MKKTRGIKRIVSLMLICVMCISMVACGKSAEKNETTTKDVSTENVGETVADNVETGTKETEGVSAGGSADSSTNAENSVGAESGVVTESKDEVTATQKVETEAATNNSIEPPVFGGSVVQSGEIYGIKWKIYDTGLLYMSGTQTGPTGYQGMEIGSVYPWNNNETITSVYCDVVANDMFTFFYGLSCCTTIKFGPNFNTSNVANMSIMFGCCVRLTSLDVSSFDTSQVTNMYEMFYGCLSLRTLDLSSFNTSKTTNMSFMFSDCYALTSLDLSSFKTSNVTNMDGMFFNCRSMQSLDLSSFETSNVTDMGVMFSGCYVLRVLDLSNFDASNAKDMFNMFDLSAVVQIKTPYNIVCDCPLGGTFYLVENGVVNKSKPYTNLKDIKESISILYSIE